MDYNIEELKQYLESNGKLLSIENKNDLLSVSCFLRDLLLDFRMVEEDPSNTDPFTPAAESQHSHLYQLFRILLRGDPYYYKKKDFDNFDNFIYILGKVLMEIYIINQNQ